MAPQAPLKRPLPTRTVAVAAASLAATALRRRLPRDVASQVFSFLAGTRAWHLDDACDAGAVPLVLCLHSAASFTTAAVCTSLAMDRAARAGNLPLVRWLDTNRSEGCSQLAFYDAAKHSHVHVLQWLFQHKTGGALQLKGLENGVLYNAVDAGQVSVVEWLCTTRPMLAPLYNVFDHACRRGHLPVVQALDRLGRQNSALAKGTTNAMDAAADQGHLDVVQWLHHHRTEGCTTHAMDYAASRGHLPVLQWLHRHRSEGCTRKALLNAASHGHVAIVQWLLDARVVPLDATLLSEAMEFAAYYDHKCLWAVLMDAAVPNDTTPPKLPVAGRFVATQMRMAT